MTDFDAKKYNLTFFKLFLFSFLSTKKVKNLINKSINDQINFFLTNFNIKKNIVYLDGHQHVHILPVVQNEIKKIFKKKKIHYKLRYVNEYFCFFFNFKFFFKILINYLKLFIIKFSYLFFKQNKNIYNTNFIGVIGTGIQNKKLIFKAISKIPKKKIIHKFYFIH